MTEYLHASNFTESGPQLVPVKVVHASDYDALAVELTRLREKYKCLVEISGTHFIRVRVLEAALEPFRHTRVRHDDLNEYAFTDLLDGTVCVVAYVRNGEMADDFNERFERIRAALDAKP